jgi:serine/threonine protein kinase/WD40 repeat protein
MPVDTCPSDADWGRWSGGLLEDHLSAEFDSHLVECESCLDRVRNAPAPDRLVLSLKALGPDEELSQGERFSIARIVEKIKLRRAESSVFDSKTGVLPQSDETLRGDASPSAVGRAEGGVAQGDRPGSVPQASGSVELEPVSRVEAGPRGAPPHPTMRDDQLATPSDAELQAGLVLGAYKLVKKLGQGGMGMVFLAEHQRMKRLVALKVLPPTVTRNHTAVQRFQREVQAMARLSHPNIVTAHDADEARGLHFLVMEYVDGQDLSDLVKKRGPLSVEQAVDYIVQGARGLEYAHKRGLVHRDIKPSNLLVDTEGHVKVLDLGLARFSDQADSEGMDLTGTGVVAGTVDYMSPEQATNTKTADARADIYSLGCTLWFLLTGKSVYGGDTVVSRLMAHQTQPIPPLRTLNSGIPEELDRVYQKMVAKQKEQRYQTVTEVLSDLVKFAPSSGGVATPKFAPDSPRPELSEQTIAGPLSSVVGLGSTVGQVASGKGAPPRVGSLVKIAAAAAFAMALLFGVWIILKDKDGKEIARIPVEQGKPVTVQATPGTTVTVENTAERVGTAATPPASGGRLTSSATKPLPAVAEDVSLPPSGNTPPKITLDLAPPAPLGTWKAGRPAAWLTGDYRHDGPVMGGLIDTPRAIPGVKRWNVDTLWTRGMINVVRFSPDGKWVALGCSDGHVRIYDAATMKLDRLLPGIGRQRGAISLDWHPNSQQLAVCEDGSVRLRTRDGGSARTIPISPGVFPINVAWDAAGGRLAIGCGAHGSAIMLEIRSADGSLVRQVNGAKEGAMINSSAPVWTADDRHVLLADRCGACAEFDVETGSKVWGVDDLAVEQDGRLALSHDGWLAVGDGDKVRLYDPERRIARTLPLPVSRLVEWHPDGRQLFAGTSLWNRDTGERAVDYGGYSYHSISWSPDASQMLISADMPVVIEFTSTGEPSGRRWGSDGNMSRLGSLLWSADGRRLACAGDYWHPEVRTIHVDAEGKAWPIQPLLYGMVRDSMPDGSALVAIGRERSMPSDNSGVWAIAADGAARLLWTLDEPVWSVRISPDGRFIAAVAQGAIDIRDTAGKPVTRIATVGDRGPDIAWWPESGELAILADNEPLRFVDPTQNWKVRTVEDKSTKLNGWGETPHWSPDGRWLSIPWMGLFDAEGRPAPENANKILVATWRADSAEYVRAGAIQTFFDIHAASGSLKRSRQTNGGLLCAAWHPRGHLIATGSQQSVLTAWRTSDLLPHWTMVLLPDEKSATFSGAGELLNPNPAAFDELLVYTIEREDGSTENLTPSQFAKFVAEADAAK